MENTTSTQLLSFLGILEGGYPHQFPFSFRMAGLHIDAASVIRSFDPFWRQLMVTYLYTEYMNYQPGHNLAFAYFPTQF